MTLKPIMQNTKIERNRVNRSALYIKQFIDGQYLRERIIGIATRSGVSLGGVGKMGDDEA